MHAAYQEKVEEDETADNNYTVEGVSGSRHIGLRADSHLAHALLSLFLDLFKQA
jgi:hypothetical protein